MASATHWPVGEHSSPALPPVPGQLTRRSGCETTSLRRGEGREEARYTGTGTSRHKDMVEAQPSSKDQERGRRLGQQGAVGDGPDVPSR